MNTNEILKKVKKIEIKTKGLSNHIFAGEYNTAFKGSGMTFSEVRGYQQGYDIRSIDWNVTARYNKLNATQKLIYKNQVSPTAQVVPKTVEEALTIAEQQFTKYGNN